MKVKLLATVFENRLFFFFYLKYVILKGAGKVHWNIWSSTSRMFIQNWWRRRERKLLKLVAVLYSVSGQVSVSSHAVTDRCCDCNHQPQNWRPCICQQRIKLGANHPLPPFLCWHLNSCCCLCSLAMWRTALSKVISLALFTSTSVSQNV